MPVLARILEIAADGMTRHLHDAAERQVPPDRAGQRPRHGHGRLEDERSSASWPSAPSASPLTDVLDKAEYPDAAHMVWKLKYPYAPLIARIWSERFAFQIMPKELNANPQLAEHDADRHRLQDPRQAPAVDHDGVPQARGVLGRRAVHRPLARADHPRVRQPLRPVRHRQHHRLHADRPRRPAAGEGRAAGGHRGRADIPDDSISRIRFGRNNHKTLPWKDPRVRIAIRRSMNLRGIGEFLANKQQFEAQASRSRSRRAPT